MLTSTSYQIRIPVHLVRRYEPTAKAGDLLRASLPFTVRPNGLLLNIDFTGARDNPIALLLRQEIAQLQAQYIAHVDGRPLGDQPLGGALWVAVSSYTPFDWMEHYARAKPSVLRYLKPGFNDSWRIRALVDYLNADLNLGISSNDVIRWLNRTEKSKEVLVRALGESHDTESSSECVLLAIPFMPVRPTRIKDIDILVNEFCTSVASMNPDARKVLAEYGRRWEVIIDTVMPIGRSCSVKMSEQRPWINTPSPIMQQTIAFGDAATTHVEVRVVDHNVEIAQPRISDLNEEREGYAVVDIVRETTEAIAIYASDTGRPYFARVEVRARLRRGHRRLAMWLLTTTAIAAGVAVALPESTDLVNSLALLTFPLTLAGAVVLSREATPLAERLLSRWRTGLVFGIVALWLVALARLLLIADVEWAESAWSVIRDLARALVSLIV